MNSAKAKVLATLVIALLVLAALPVLAGVPECLAQGGGLTPENTVILSNETDASFCKDFSVLLRQTSLQWIVLDSAEVPESARDKNIILIGRPDAEHAEFNLEGEAGGCWNRGVTSGSAEVILWLPGSILGPGPEEEA